MAVRDCVMLLLLLLLLAVALPPVLPLPGDRPDEVEAGSGCEDAANYFDYIGVDDEDYVSEEEEGSTDLFENLIRGPPVFTDSDGEEVSDGMSPETRDEGERPVYPLVYPDRTPSPPVSTDKIIPESLLIKNRTHGKLNGNLVITNNEDQEETGSELFFEEEQKPSEEEQNVQEILSESLGSKMSISVLCIIIIFIMLL